VVVLVVVLVVVVVDVVELVVVLLVEIERTSSSFVCRSIWLLITLLRTCSTDRSIASKSARVGDLGV
jgi:hypothetical protein